MSSEFESWLTGKLTEFNADAEVFSSYILGILDSDESAEEKVTNLQDLLEGLGLDDGKPDACQRVEKEIWTQWTNTTSKSENSEAEKPKNLADLGAAVVAHAESQTQAYKAKGPSTRLVYS